MMGGNMIIRGSLGGVIGSPRKKKRPRVILGESPRGFLPKHEDVSPLAALVVRNSSRRGYYKRPSFLSTFIQESQDRHTEHLRQKFLPPPVPHFLARAPGTFARRGQFRAPGPFVRRAQFASTNRTTTV